jgi:hypothetical protein
MASENLDARYFGDHPDFFPGEYVSLAIYAEDDDLYPGEWIIFPRRGGEGIEVDPGDVYILED